MNIKGFGVNNHTPLESRPRAESKGEIRSQESSDRDADGRRQNDGQGQEEALTEEHIEKAIQYLESHSGVKDNGLSVKRVESNGKLFLVIEDHLGAVVRRIPQSQIYTLAQDPNDQSSKGRLYSRTG